MRVVHEPAEGDGTRTLASDVEVAEGLWAKFRGLRFRRSIPEHYALVFEFSHPGRRDIDMLFVRTPLDVLWLEDERVRQVKTLRPWIGFGLARADCVIELPPDAADGVEAGDRVVVEGEDDSTG
ncbi:Uncharacterized protein SVXHr_2131 [Halorhabdus sp. SVX81]|uniref:DUF192 domain-containing protein n=1 Tax=Halorhabdus sp. SVX81 TaxID=2978283 RepID=UPI0023D98703|nr:DUF192 domain-containing protein [Halorhabdus sp. SVX81]WEL18288.1 Uncharacterized protein SVXHr_2131 [Halorhabdus sp. SVX81]